MGQSTDGVLFYGYCWQEEKNLLDSDDDVTEWPDVVMAKRGLPNPFLSGPDVTGLSYNDQQTAWKKWKEDNQQRIDGWFEAKKAATGEFGCDVDSHCSCEAAMPYVFITRSRIVAHRGYPKTINPGMMIVDAGWDEQLDVFLSEIGVVKPDGQESPQWWLVSNWC